MSDMTERQVEALDNIALELWRLRLLREYELRAHVIDAPSGDIYVETEEGEIWQS